MVRDRRAPCEVDRLDPAGRVRGNVRHAPVRNVLAVRQGQPLETGAADHGARRERRLRRLVVVLSPMPSSSVGRLLLLVMMGSWRDVWDDPADDAGEEVVAHLAAVAEIYLFETLGSIGHLQDSGAGDVPNRFHLPRCHVGAALEGERCEAFVRDVEAVTDVDDPRPVTDERAYDLVECGVGDAAVVSGEIEYMEDVW